MTKKQHPARRHDKHTPLFVPKSRRAYPFLSKSTKYYVLQILKYFVHVIYTRSKYEVKRETQYHTAVVSVVCAPSMHERINKLSHLLGAGSPALSAHGLCLSSSLSLLLLLRVREYWCCVSRLQTYGSAPGDTPDYRVHFGNVACDQVILLLLLRSL